MILMFERKILLDIAIVSILSALFEKIVSPGDSIIVAIGFLLLLVILLIMIPAYFIHPLVRHTNANVSTLATYVLQSLLVLFLYIALLSILLFSVVAIVSPEFFANTNFINRFARNFSVYSISIGGSIVLVSLIHQKLLDNELSLVHYFKEFVEALYSS